MAKEDEEVVTSFYMEDVVYSSVSFFLLTDWNYSDTSECFIACSRQAA